MKKKQVAVAASALLVLLLFPCIHAETHHHDDDHLNSLCAAAHTECRNCSSAPCSSSSRSDLRPADSSPSVELPVRQVFHVDHIKSRIPDPLPVALAFSKVLPILTVQLLI